MDLSADRCGAFAPDTDDSSRQAGQNGDPQGGGMS